MTPEEMQALKSQGFGITTNEDLDLFDSMMARFMVGQKGTSAKQKAKAIQEFVSFCKEELLKNPPVTMTFLDNGLALQLADYTRVVLVNAVEKSNSRASSVTITDAEKKGGPVVYRQIDTSVPITR
jgi:hypothetical protein